VDSLAILAIILVFKIPILGACWYLYRIIHDVPQPEIESEGDEFARARFEPGPRKRGPHGGPHGGPPAPNRQRGRDKTEKTPSRRSTSVY
jgi:hypothetical protein